MRVLTAYFVGHKSNRLTALKTMSLRLTTTKAKLQEMGEETEYACETLSAYRDLILGLTANTLSSSMEMLLIILIYSILGLISGYLTITINKDKQ